MSSNNANGTHLLLSLSSIPIINTGYLVVQGYPYGDAGGVPPLAENLPHPYQIYIPPPKVHPPLSNSFHVITQ